ncbi:MAG: NUDIX hydrolase [Acidobacteriota bacterium]|nr:NUDIX hydrolase [Acidobacteriota bacterium]
MDEKNPESDLLDRKAYNGKILKLHVDTVRLESGESTIREVVRHPGGVAAIPVMDDGRIVLIRQFRYPLGKFIWEIPAGKLDSGQSPRDTAARELEEEIGCVAGTLTAACAFYSSPGFCDEVIHLFVASDLTPCPRRLEVGEHITPEPRTLAECLQMVASGEIMDGKSVLGLLWYAANRKLPKGGLGFDKQPFRG